MKPLYLAALLSPLLMLSVHCEGDVGPSGVGGAGGSRVFNDDAGNGANAPAGGVGGSAAAGTSGSVGSGGLGGSAGSSVSGTGGAEVGAGGIVGSGGTGGMGATGGTIATGGSGAIASGVGGSAGTPATPGITATAALDPNSCNRTLRYQVSGVRYDDGQSVPSFTCQWVFDDGGTANLCAGQHEFSSAGFHSATVRVSDSTNGATTSAATPSVPVYDPLVIDVVASAPACGLWFSYTTTKTGGFNGGRYFVDIQPSQNVLTLGRWSQDATVVALPGTYTVLVTREEEANNALCTAYDSAQVIVNACP